MGFLLAWVLAQHRLLSITLAALAVAIGTYRAGARQMRALRP